MWKYEKMKIKATIKTNLWYSKQKDKRGKKNRNKFIAPVCQNCNSNFFSFHPKLVLFYFIGAMYKYMLEIFNLLKFSFFFVCLFFNIFLMYILLFFGLLYYIVGLDLMYYFTVKQGTMDLREYIYCSCKNMVIKLNWSNSIFSPYYFYYY